MQDEKTLLAMCEEEEERLQFEQFSRADALALGLKIHENAKKQPVPVAIEITVNGLVVFRYFPDGALPDSELWLARKRNSVELMEMSSLHFLAWLEQNGETLESRKLPANEYAAGGGGFPIRLRGTGVIGSICVSGLPDHREDHRLVVDTLAEFLG
ncbi:heme-degrading domain-containing protein [Agathobaculum sp. Marseille-P7918]|uniref:heme-degrading domain-containing protein n=1 Tax=Agathobaculum sp. Marseille-P7918 TaxID=2479843 RepID=UPI0013DE0916|nr:heme-binding protein [Agathobaculum sp. Marseille-P7918]